MSFNVTDFDPEKAQALARKTFEIEAAAVLSLASRVGPEFAAAVHIMLACRGRVVVMGMAKAAILGAR